MANKALAENVGQVISDFDGIKAAIIEKGQSVPDGTPTSTYGQKILDIKSDGKRESGWMPHTDWWDIDTMVDTGILEWTGEKIENVRYGYVVSDRYDTTRLPSGYHYYLSDGSYYYTTSTIEHTWNKTKDKPSIYGCATRAVIVCATSRDVTVNVTNFTNSGVDALYLYLGDCAPSVTVGGSSASVGNSLILGIRHNDKTSEWANTSMGNLFNYCTSIRKIMFQKPLRFNSIQSSSFQNCTMLEFLDVPEGIVGISSYGIAYCTYLLYVRLPSTLTTIDSTVFMGCTNLRSVSVPSGFAQSINLSASSALFVSCMESIIDRAADRTGLSTITLTFGASNLTRLSTEYKQKAVDKNITLA